MKSKSLLAVMYVKIIGNYVLPCHNTVAEALNSNVSYNVVVVLIPRKDQSRRMARVVQKFLSKNGISHIFRQRELTVGYVNTAYVLKIYC